MAADGVQAGSERSASGDSPAGTTAPGDGGEGRRSEEAVVTERLGAVRAGGRRTDRQTDTETKREEGQVLKEAGREEI